MLAMEYYIKRFSALFCLVAVLTSNGAEAAVGANCASVDCDTANHEVCDDPSKICECDSASGYVVDGSNCVLVDCGAPDTPTNGAVDTSGGTLFDNVATFSCDTGYTPDTTVTTTCQAAATWTTTTHTCTIKDCGAPDTPTNGAVDTSGGTLFDNVATFSCNTGYTPDTTVTTTCQAAATWTTTTHTCTIKDCGAITAPTNGAVVTSAGTLYNSEATFSCNTGYTPEATVTTTCQANATWTMSTHTCTIKDCETPPVPANSNVTLTVDGVTTYGANATVSCSAGFTCNGELTCAITCESSGWTSVVCSGAASIVSGVVLIGVCGLVSVLFHL